jgi:hypothetical protein
MTELYPGSFSRCIVSGQNIPKIYLKKYPESWKNTENWKYPENWKNFGKRNSCFCK